MTPGPIRATDRVADVLARDEGLVEVFAATAPAFERLRRPALRRVMARLVTVEQAARIAGVDPAALLARLNEALADTGSTPAAGPVAAAPATPSATAGSGPRPAALAAIPADRVVELDVRDALRAGEEPFSRIMAARREVPEDGALMLRAIFEPAPLYAVLGKQGFEHWTERRGDEDWVVWFYRAGTEVAAPTPERAPEVGRAASGEDDVVVLDVRGLEPPEPMVRTLAALESLAPGGTLVQVNVREPRFLLPQLAERGFVYEVREQAPDLVRVFIRHAEGD